MLFQFEIGEQVRVSRDRGELERLQEGYGGFSSRMARVGRLLTILYNFSYINNDVKTTLKLEHR